MTRQIILVFFGRERFGTDSHAGDHDTPGHGHTPHESPVLMLFPLGVLAVLAVVGGAINQPFGGKNLAMRLEHWLDESFIPGTEIHAFVSSHGSVASGTKLTLAVIATLCGLAGIALGASQWLTRTSPESQAALELPLQTIVPELFPATLRLTPQLARQAALIAADPFELPDDYRPEARWINVAD